MNKAETLYALARSLAPEVVAGRMDQQTAHEVITRLSSELYKDATKAPVIEARATARRIIRESLRRR